MTSLCTIARLYLIAAAFAAGLSADGPARLIVEPVEYPGNYKPDGMWAGLYAAANGKVYTGLCTHGGSALFYEYDPVSGRNRLVADMGEFLRDKGTGERAHGKIHTRFAEDDEGWIYFATGNQGSGPSQIDPSTWVGKGAHLIRYDPSAGRLEDLGQVTPNFGAYGLAIDRKRRCAYLTTWDNHLYRFDIERRASRDLGRVSNWDANRMIAIDGEGNVYGTSQHHWIWKYEAAVDRLVELPLQVPHDASVKLGYKHGRPVLDRRQIWRYVEWDPVDRKIYGVECGRSLLFEFDPADGPGGSTRVPADMALDQHRKEHRFPYATLAMGLSPGKAIYYGTVSRSFDYSAADQETEVSAGTYLRRFDLKTGNKNMLGLITTADGRRLLGLGGCEVAPDGTVYLCGALDEPDESKAVGRVAGRDPFRLQLMIWKPTRNRK